MTKFEPAWAIVTASNHVVAVCDSVALAASEIARLSVARMIARTNYELEIDS